MGELKVEIIFGSSTEEVLDFKCCSFIDQNAEILVYNISEHPVTITSSCRLAGAEKSQRIDYLYPYGPRTIAPCGVEAFYCRIDENQAAQFATITFYGPADREYESPLIIKHPEEKPK